jgi:hypothetical protein
MLGLPQTGAAWVPEYGGGGSGHDRDQGHEERRQERKASITTTPVT